MNKNKMRTKLKLMRSENGSKNKRGREECLKIIRNWGVDRKGERENKAQKATQRNIFKK